MGRNKRSSGAGRVLNYKEREIAEKKFRKHKLKKDKNINTELLDNLTEAFRNGWNTHYNQSRRNGKLWLSYDLYAKKTNLSDKIIDYLRGWLK